MKDFILLCNVQQMNNYKKNIKMETNKIQTTFQKWYDAIPSGKLKNVRNRLITDCFITRSTLSNWKNGVSEPPRWHWEKINKIAKEELNQVVYHYENAENHE